MWNFHGSWFSALEIPAKSATQFCGISRGEASCCMEFQKSAFAITKNRRVQTNKGISSSF